jgi:hypothetical protein
MLFRDKAPSHSGVLNSYLLKGHNTTKKSASRATVIATKLQKCKVLFEF